MHIRGIVLLTCVASLGVAIGCGPLGPIPGGALRGAVHTVPPTDWRFVDDVDTIQLETRSGKPYSVNVWCGEVDGNLYVPTSLILGPDDPTERSWVRNVEKDPRVRLRVEGGVYELRAVRVEDVTELEHVRAALLAKYEVDADAHAEKAWIYRMDPR